MKLKLLLFLCIVFVQNEIFSQQNLVAAGGNAQSTSGSVSYSVGQVDYTTSIGGNVSVTQGVQQPFEISVLGSDAFIDIDLAFVAYPNPTADVLVLKSINYSIDNLSYQLFDLNGRLLLEAKITADETFISMGNRPSSNYFVYVFDGNRNIKTFQIVKK